MKGNTNFKFITIGFFQFEGLKKVFQGFIIICFPDAYEC